MVGNGSMEWGLVNNGMVNWNAVQTISNAFLVLVLICITIYYAAQTHKQAKILQNQLAFDRTFRPRLGAYQRFTDLMLKRKMKRNLVIIRNNIIPELEYIQPFSSQQVRDKSKGLLEVAKVMTELAEKEKRGLSETENEELIEIERRIVEELVPIITNEITDITLEEV